MCKIVAHAAFSSQIEDLDILAQALQNLRLPYMHSIFSPGGDVASVRLTARQLSSGLREIVSFYIPFEKAEAARETSCGLQSHVFLPEKVYNQPFRGPGNQSSVPTANR